MCTWREKRLGDYISINPATLTVAKYNGSIQYIDISSVSVGQLYGYAEYDINDAPSRARRIIQPNDIIFSTVRPNLRAYYYVKECPTNAICSTGFAVLRAKKNANSRFIYYLVTEKSFVDYLSLVAKGSAYPAVDTNDFKKAKVSIPDLPTQQRIADILSAYDDLIENNNKRIALLEKAAQELYKEWFVRFRFPGHETTKFVNGLPEGWEVKRMNDFCYVTDGTHDTPKPVDNGVPLITGRCIKNGYVDFNAAYSISFEDHEKIKKRSGLKTGDILLSNIGTVGNTCRVIYDREFSVKNVIIFKPDSDLISHYLYYLLISQSAQDIFAAQTNGASQQFVGLTFMRRFKILVPSGDVLTAFSKKVESLLKHKDNLFAQNQNLAKQRDLLLPRLMSGKLEV